MWQKVWLFSCSYRRSCCHTRLHHSSFLFVYRALSLWNAVPRALLPFVLSLDLFGKRLLEIHFGDCFSFPSWYCLNFAGIWRSWDHSMWFHIPLSFSKERIFYWSCNRNEQKCKKVFFVETTKCEFEWVKNRNIRAIIVHVQWIVYKMCNENVSIQKNCSFAKCDRIANKASDSRYKKKK